MHANKPPKDEKILTEQGPFLISHYRNNMYLWFIIAIACLVGVILIRTSIWYTIFMIMSVVISLMMSVYNRRKLRETLMALGNADSNRKAGKSN